MPLPPDDPARQPIEFFVAHGEPNACGPGCDEWIAGEGKIVVDSMGRLERLLGKLGNRRLPLFLHSPGGTVIPGLALGRLIRERKLTVSVGRTLTPGCHRDKAGGDDCEARKRAGQPIEATLDPNSALCNSACVFALAGGAVRLVPPWVKLGIHDAGLDPHAHHVSELVFDASMQSTHIRIRNYLHEMGMSDALFAAVLATPNSSLKPLQRDDVVRFGIDRREFGEGAWTYVDKPKPHIQKLFFTRTDEAPAYIDAAVILDCGFAQTLNLKFARQALASDSALSGNPPAPVAISSGGTPLIKPIATARTSFKNFYIRWGQVLPHALDKVGDDATLQLPRSEFARKSAPDATVTLSMQGFAGKYAKLQAACADLVHAAQTAAQASAQAGPQFRSQQPPNNQQKQRAAEVTAFINRLGKEQAQQHVAGSPLPAVAQNEPVAPAAPAPPPGLPSNLNLSRIVAADQKTRIEFLYAIQPDCSPSGPITVRIEGKPQHGTATAEDGQGFTNFPRNNQRYDCNTRKSDGTMVFYQADPGYRGPDSMTVLIIYPFGMGQTRQYSIDVK